MLATVTGGMGPCTGVLDFAAQTALGGVLRFVGLFYLRDFRGIVAKHA